MTVLRGHFFRERNALLALDVIGYYFDEKFQPFHFRAKRENGLPFIEILDILGELKAHSRAIQFRLLRDFGAFHLQQLAISVCGFLSQIRWDGGRVFIIEIFDFGTKIRFVLVERGDLKTTLADSQEIEPAIRIASHYPIDESGTSDIYDSVVFG